MHRCLGQARLHRPSPELQTKEILDAALQLPDKERERLVEELAASLHSGFASTEIEQAWASEIERRSAEIDTGKAVLRDWDEVRDEILAEHRLPA